MLLKNCRIVTSRGIIQGDILIEDGRIKEIARGIKNRGEEGIDAKNRLVLPGVVDVHVHMRDFKEKRKEDFFSGSKAAIAGGVTTFIDMPNTKPPITDYRTFKQRLKIADRKSIADFGINFGINSKNLDEVGKVQAPSYKLYLDGALGELSPDVIVKAFQQLPRVSVHAEDYETVNKNYQRLKNKKEFLAHARIRSGGAEELAVKRSCELAKEHKRATHICHISKAKSLSFLNEYTSCEVTPHHLFLTEKALEEKKGIVKTNPPLRTSKDQKALWRALVGGKIDIIASDHSPHTLEEKEADVHSTPSGISNLEVTLRLLLTQVNRGTIPIFRIAELMCENPANIFGIKNKGAIKPGGDADLVILDLKKESNIDASGFFSKSRYSPFDGWKTVGAINTVILRGEVAFEDQEILLKRGFGEQINIA